MAVSLSLEEAVQNYPLPQVFKVVEGFCSGSETTEEDFSTNDVIQALKVQCPKMVIEAEINSEKIRIDVSSRNKTLFRLRPPDRRREFSSVRELCQYWPLAAEALRNHSPPIRPDAAARPPVDFVEGDILHLLRKNSAKSELEYKKNNRPDILRLSVDYVGPFREVVDKTHLYTLGQLADMAPVPRRLTLRHQDQRKGHGHWIAELPADFSGPVVMLTPVHYVEVFIMSDSESDRKSNETTLVRLDNQMRLQERCSNYECVTNQQLKLSHLASRPDAQLPRIVRVVDWEEETTILSNHSVRPGQLLIFFERIKINKLAVSDSRRQRHLLVPQTHTGKFRCPRDIGSGQGGWPGSRSGSRRTALTDLDLDTAVFPFTITYLEDDDDYINLTDDALPVGVELRADGLVRDDCVVAARISDCDLTNAVVDDAFHLPLRTRLTVCLGERLRQPVSRVMSRRNEQTELLTENVYNSLIGAPPAVGFVLPQLRVDMRRPD